MEVSEGGGSPLVGEGEGSSPAAFRRDVQGLRGVAVLLVVAFHCRVEQLSAGFVGVDVFFLLSGHLISQRISPAGGEKPLTDSLKEFYARRLMRICPLLVLCVGLVVAGGWSVLAFDDLSGLILSALSAIFGGSNAYFFATIEGGYFATDTRKLPLLHTWSLSAELQFYLLYPLLGLLPPSLGFPVSMLVFSSSAVWFFGMGGSGGSAYFLLPPRLWQFLGGWLAGSVLGPRLSAASPTLSQRTAREVALLLSLAGLLAAASGGLPDGASSAVACSAAAAVIALGSEAQPEGLALGTRLLLSRPLQVFGDISYSLYVWHWPVLSFLDIAMGNIPSSALLASMLPVILLSLVTKPLVEDFWRKRDVTLLKALALCVLLPAAMLCCFWAGLQASPHLRGFPKDSVENVTRPASAHNGQRSGNERVLNEFAERVRALARKSSHPPSMNQNGPLRDFCAEHMKDPAAKLSVRDGCRLGLNDSGPVEVLLTGDSHAWSFAGFVDTLLRGAGRRGLLAAKVAVPLAHGDFLPDKPTADWARRLVDLVERLAGLEAVVVGANWDAWHDGRAGRKSRSARTYRRYETAFNTTLTLLRKRGLQVFLIIDFPSAQGRPKMCNFMRLPKGRCLIDRLRSDEYQRSSRDMVQRLARIHSAKLLSINDVICDERHCKMAIDGLPLYFDTKETPNASGHLNFVTSAIVGEKYLSQFSNPFS